MSSYKDLLVWQKARVLVKDVYTLCSELPTNETYGLSAQLKRAAVSVPSNIAEGYRRNNRKEYVQFLGIAAGSAAELETQLILVSDLFQLETEPIQSAVNEIQKMLAVLLKKLDPRR